MAAYLNTDDLKKRLEELREWKQSYEDGEDGYEEPTYEEQRELRELEEMESGITDWLYGETLIPEDEFTDYAQQLAEDIGAIGSDLQWPLMYIDWDAAAEALKQDYTEFEYLGTTYYARA